MSKTINKTIAKGILRKLVVFALVAIIVAVISENASAASVSVSGGDNVSGGDTFTVTVRYSGDSVGRVVADMTYDKSSMTYISGGSSSGNNGIIELKNAGTGEDIVFNIKFQALESGSASIKVDTVEMYDLAEQYLTPPDAVFKTVTISGDAEEDEIIEESTAPEEEYDTSLIYVDEKEEPVNYTMILIMGAVIAAILVIIIAIVIKRRR